MEDKNIQSTLTDPLNFVLAGRAVFTVLNTATGRRFTYKVRANTRDGGPSHFVMLLTGSDNVNDYSYLGCIFEGSKYYHGRKSRIGRDALGAKAFTWLFARLISGKELPASLQIYHEGRCGKCGRTLTTPASIQLGFGPICSK